MKKIIFILCLVLLNFISYSQITIQDACASANVLIVNNFCVNNTFTMPSSFANNGGYPNTGCSISNNDDGWYKFKAISIVTEITVDATEDIIIHAYSGACGALTLIGCSDNETTNAEIINIPTTIGAWYYIRIQRYNSSAGITNGTICLYNTNKCNWTLCLSASSGNSGWYGAYFQVLVNGISIGYTNFTTGNGPLCYVIPATMSDVISFIFTGGTNNGRCKYTLYDDLGSVYHSVASSPSNYSYVQTCNSSLPIELENFNVSCDGSKRSGTFITASEHNVNHYIVQSSIDMISWNNVTTIFGNGNSTASHSYVWNDVINYGLQLLVYYQLIEYDNDGYTKTFGPYSLNCNISSKAINLWPNPAQSNENINIVGSVAEIKIYDIIGKEVSFGLKENNTIYGLSSGLYVVVVNGINTFKLIVK